MRNWILRLLGVVIIHEHDAGMPNPTWGRHCNTPQPSRPRFQRPYTISRRPRMARPAGCGRKYL
jgi:hypothetical protein